MELNQLTISECAAKLTAREASSEDLVRSCLARIEAVEGRVHACLSVHAEAAIAAARAADGRRASGETGELLGIPMIVKDVIMTKGLPTTAASKILENYIAPYDATVVRRLKEAGTIVIAKANLDEFAHGASTENSAFGPTHNPWDLERTPGGSSGGSAAALAADECIFSLGTDTGGSIRHPASYCGVVGLKPSYGRASRHGLIAMTSSTDVPGPFAKSVADIALVLSTMAGPDELDATSADRPVDDYRHEITRPVKGMRIGWPREFFPPELNPAMRSAMDEARKVLTGQGVEFVEISLPHTKYAVATYYIITPSEVSSNLGRFDGIKYGLSANGEVEDILSVYRQSRGRGFGPEAKRRIMLGTFALSAGYFDAYYLKAQKVRTVITRELEAELEHIDAIMTPTAPHPAFKLGEKADPLAMYLEDIYLSSASLAGLPAISVPAGFIAGLPVGLQLIGRRFDEASILRLGQAYEQATKWHTRRAEL